MIQLLFPFHMSHILQEHHAKPRYGTQHNPGLPNTLQWFKQCRCPVKAGLWGQASVNCDPLKPLLLSWDVLEALIELQCN